jgi:hypothetical protein
MDGFLPSYLMDSKAVADQQEQLRRQREEEMRRSREQAQMQTQAAPQGGGMNPLSMAQSYNNIAPMFGGEPLWGGGAASSGGASAGGASSSSGLGASMGAMAWPAALAAVIAGNETWANKEGRRPDDFSEHAGDMLTGKVLERDADALSQKMPGLLGDVTKLGGQMAHPKGVYDAGADALSWLKGLF